MSLVHTDCITPHPRPNLIAVLRTWISLSRQRRALATLSDAQLDDIAVSAQEARTEANRPIWDVPAHWTR